MSMDKRSCKICHGDEMEGDELCTPCRCSGTIKYIHRGCLVAWMECSKITRCDICHYEYRFKDVYRPDTPHVLPLSVLARGVAGTGWKVCVVVAWCVVQTAKWAGVFYFNGSLFMVSTGLWGVGGWPTPRDNAMCVLAGIPLTWLAQVNRCLFSQIREKLRGDARRRMPVDARGVEAMGGPDAQDVRDEEEMGISASTGSERSMASDARGPGGARGRWPRGLRNPMDDFVFRPVMSGVGELTLPVSFISVIYGASRLVPVPRIQGSFGMFLSAVDLEALYYRLLGFVVAFWGAVECVGRVRKAVGVRGMRCTCIFMKTYLIILMNVFVMNLTFGLVLHCMFGRIVNKGAYVLCLEDRHGAVIRGAVSLMFHMSVGYTFSVVIRNILLRFKAVFRPGVLHFVPDDEDSKMDELYEASKTKAQRILMRLVAYLVLFSLFYGVGLAVIRWVCGEVGVRFSIGSFLKLSLSYKAVGAVLNSSKMLGDYLVEWIGRVVRMEARMLGMENFLYNVRMEGCDRKQLAWCANRNRIFRGQHVEARRRRRPTEQEILKHFNTRSKSAFGIFYVPRLFGARCALIVVSVALPLYAVCAGYALAAKWVVQRVGAEAYVRGSNDIVFYLAVVLLARVSWTAIHVCASARGGGRRMMRAVGNLCKHGVVNVYINMVYPMFGSLMVVMLSSDEGDGVRPLRLFLFFFSSTSVVESVLSSSPESYTFRGLIRELCKINALVSVVFGIWYVYSAVTVLLELSSVEFAVLSAAVGYVVFVSKKIGKTIESDRGFYRRLLDENYLIERRVVNVDEE